MNFTSLELNTFRKNKDVKIPSCLFASLNLKEGFHGIAHGTVFMVNVHLSAVNIGSNGVMFVSQRPIRL